MYSPDILPHHRPKSKEANQIGTTKTASQNKLFSSVSWLSQVFVVVTKSWTVENQPIQGKRPLNMDVWGPVLRIWLVNYLSYSKGQQLTSPVHTKIDSSQLFTTLFLNVGKESRISTNWRNPLTWNISLRWTNKKKREEENKERKKPIHLLFSGNCWREVLHPSKSINQETENMIWQIGAPAKEKRYIP